MEAKKLELISAGDVEKELIRVQLVIKGIGDESYISFKRLLNYSDEVFSSLNRSAQTQAMILNSLIQDTKQNETAQENLFIQWIKGAITTTNENKKTALESLQEEVQQYKKQYAALDEFERNLGKEQGDKDFTNLKSHGENYQAYLTGKINEIHNKQNPTKEDNINLSYLMTEHRETTPKFNVTEFKLELEKKRQLYQEDLNSYISYLEDYQILLNPNTTIGSSDKKKIVEEEIKGAQEVQQKSLNDLLKQYQSYSTKMASLSKDYQIDINRLAGTSNTATTDEEKERINYTIDARTDTYTQSVAELEAENSDFSRILFRNLEKTSRSALNNIAY